MDVRGEGEARLAELKGLLLSVQGTPTEVYSRIVGYYRSVRNWNAGKREEFSRRKEYSFPEASLWETPSAVVGEAEACGPEPTGLPADGSQAARCDAGARPVSYLLFTRLSCHQCPPVREYMAGTQLLGQVVDVDRDEGPDLARAYEVMATPTVVLLDVDGEELARGYTKAQLMAYIAPVAEVSYA